MIENAKLPCIGLFGTCGDSKWRVPFIETYQEKDIPFYNPQVENWTPECAIEEAEHLVNDQIILFPVTSETYGTGSLAETGFSILSAIRSNINRFIIIYIESKPDLELAKNAELYKESVRARALVSAHLKKNKHPNVFVVNSLQDMRYLSVRLYDVVSSLNRLHHMYRQE